MSLPVPAELEEPFGMVKNKCVVASRVAVRPCRGDEDKQKVRRYMRPRRRFEQNPHPLLYLPKVGMGGPRSHGTTQRYRTAMPAPQIKRAPHGLAPSRRHIGT